MVEVEVEVGIAGFVVVVVVVEVVVEVGIAGFVVVVVVDLVVVVVCRRQFSILSRGL